jgi:autotransporter-associated beta strand protein
VEAHTTVTGYTTTGSPPLVTLWFGTYHSETQSQEGTVSVSGANGYAFTGPFTLFQSTEPANLSGIQRSRNTAINFWQGVTLATINPGTYSYIYNPDPASRSPDVWQPEAANGSFQIQGIIDRRYPFFTLSSFEANDNPVQFSGGTLQMSAGTFASNVIPTPVTIDANGGYIDTSTGDGGFSGTVTGMGSLTINGGGTFTVSGRNTNPGPTTLNNSRLRIGDGGTSGSIVGDVVNNGGTLEFNRADSVSFAGAIRGSGTLLHSGQGTTTLAASSSYSGPTIAANGTLAAGTVNAFGTGDVWVLPTGMLEVGNYTLSNVAVNVAGGVAGTLHTTAGNAKIVMNNGNVSGGVILEASQVLTGLGSIGGVLDFGGGTVIPGSGTLRVGTLSGPGNLVWSEGHLIGVTSAADSNMNGVYVSTPSSFSAGNLGANITTVGKVEYPVVVPAAGGSGMVDISGVTNPAIGTPVISFGLRSTHGGRGVAFVKQRVSYSEFATGDNAFNFGKYLDGQLPAPGYGTTDVGVLLKTLDTTPTAEGVTGILRSMDVGGAYASLYTAAVRRNLALVNSIDRHLDEVAAGRANEEAFALGVRVAPAQALSMLEVPNPSPEHDWIAWISGYANRYSKGGNLGVRIEDYQSQAEGGVIGVEKVFGAFRAGVILASGGGKVSFQDPTLNVTLDDWHIGGYGSLALGDFTLDFSGVWGEASNEALRPLGRKVYRATFDSTDHQVGIGVSARLSPRDRNWSVTPVARLKYVHYNQDALTEVGGGLPFRTDRMSHGTVLSKVGVRLAYGQKLTPAVGLGIDGGLYWVHDFDSDSRRLNMALANAPIPGTFSVRSRGSELNTVQMNLGVQFSFADRTSLRIGGQKEMGQDGRENSGAVSMTYKF